jgi:Uma2 family endonuclease
MFHESLLAQILELPDAPMLDQKANEMFHQERQRREKFYNRATNRDIDESMKVEFINGEIIVHSPVMKRHNEANRLLFQLIKVYCFKRKLGFVGIEKIMSTFTRNDYEPDLVFFGNEKADTFKEEQTLFLFQILSLKFSQKAAVRRPQLTMKEALNLMITKPIK